MRSEAKSRSNADFNHGWYRFRIVRAIAGESGRSDHLPPSTIISKAAEKKIPIMAVSSDTYTVAKKIETMEALLTSKDENRRAYIKKLVEDNINIDKL